MNEFTKIERECRMEEKRETTKRYLKRTPRHLQLLWMRIAARWRKRRNQIGPSKEFSAICKHPALERTAKPLHSVWNATAARASATCLPSSTEVILFIAWSRPIPCLCIEISILFLFFSAKNRKRWERNGAKKRNAKKKKES